MGTSDHNIVPTKRVIHDPYTVVIFSFTTVDISVNDSLPPFTNVIMMDMGIVIKTTFQQNSNAFLFLKKEHSFFQNAFFTVLFYGYFSLGNRRLRVCFLIHNQHLKYDTFLLKFYVLSNYVC